MTRHSIVIYKLFSSDCHIAGIVGLHELVYVSIVSKPFLIEAKLLSDIIRTIRIIKLLHKAKVNWLGRTKV